MTLILHPEARDEMIESARYYSNAVPKLGQDFLDAVDLAFDQIAEDPFRWKQIFADVRRYLMPRFPYGIFYQVRASVINVVAIAHFSRHPDYWKYRTV